MFQVYREGMKKLLAAAAISTITILGFAGMASAQELIPGPAGTCLQPGTNPPVQVPCTSTEATTPRVPDPTTTVVSTIPLLGSPAQPFTDGTCWQPGTNPPLHVACDAPEATTPRVIAAPGTTPTTVAAIADVPIEPAAVETVALRHAPARPVMRSLPTTGASAPILLALVAVLLVAGGLLMRVRTATD